MHFNEFHKKSVAKISGKGCIEYGLSTDRSGFLYVQIKENSESGTHAEGIYFSMQTLVALMSGAASLPLPGFTSTGSSTTIGDLNVPGFLKAIANDLLPKTR